MLSRQIVTKAKCYQGKMLPRQNVIKAKCYQGKMLPRQNVTRQNVTRQSVTRQNITEPLKYDIFDSQRSFQDNADQGTIKCIYFSS